MSKKTNAPEEKRGITEEVKKIVRSKRGNETASRQTMNTTKRNAAKAKEAMKPRGGTSEYDVLTNVKLEAVGDESARIYAKGEKIRLTYSNATQRLIDLKCIGKPDEE